MSVFMDLLEGGWNALLEYLSAHVLTCLVPAFFIAGAIAVFISQAAVLKYFGPKANKLLSYSVASVSGTILAVCSCTVLPLFGGIYKRGAGIGPAVAFLYSGPAINVLAIVLTHLCLLPALMCGCASVGRQPAVVAVRRIVPENRDQVTRSIGGAVGTTVGPVIMGVEHRLIAGMPGW